MKLLLSHYQEKRGLVGLSDLKSLARGQNHQKSSLKECGFANSALKIQCHIVKNTAISAILPTGLPILIQKFQITYSINSKRPSKASSTFHTRLSR